MTDNEDFDPKRRKLMSPEELEFMRESQRNWRSWGSWFSWGSPVGLGLWFVLMAAALWIGMQAFR